MEKIIKFGDIEIQKLKKKSPTYSTYFSKRYRY